MPRPPSPTMRKRALGKELRKLREAAEVSPAGAAEELDCSLAKVRHIENGRNVIKKTELSALVRLYGAEDRLAVLEEIRREASKPGWWSTAHLPPYMQTYIGAETDAKSMSIFTLEVVPGLLQVEEYIRDVNKIAGFTDVERYVRLRVQRQQRLFDEEAPLTLHAVCSEGVIRRLAHLPYAKAQLLHMVTMSERPNVTLQILPLDTGLHLSMQNSLVLLDFDPEISLPAAYFENVVNGDFVDDQKIVKDVAARFAKMAEWAMSPDDTIRFLKEWLA